MMAKEVKQGLVSTIAATDTGKEGLAVLSFLIIRTLSLGVCPWINPEVEEVIVKISRLGGRVKETSKS
jgi:hypothetical protein